MADLTFVYGAMGCGKTTELMRMYENHKRRGFRPFIIKPSDDTKAQGISSRLGVEMAADLVSTQDMDLIFELHSQRIDIVLVDEAQFLTPQQVTQLYSIAHGDRPIPVICYGLRSDFRTNSFPGSLRLFELADVFTEIPTLCKCGRKATFNIRYKNGVPTTIGDQVAIEGDEAVYDVMCGTCRARLML